jgi:hypothetical protein
MNPKTIAKIKVSNYWKGLTPGSKPHEKKWDMYSFDVETTEGVPYALDIFDGGNHHYIYGRKRLVNGFIAFCHSLLMRKKSGVIVMAAHNLHFDLGVLLFKHAVSKQEITLSGLEMKWETSRGQSWEVIFGVPTFGRVRYGNATLNFIDTWSWFQTSLDKAAKSIGMGFRKLKPPSDLGKRDIPKEELRTYIQRDTLLCHGLLKQIKTFHELSDVPLSVSAPSMTAKTFRKNYVKKPYAKPTSGVRVAAMLSYHGGKNGMYVDPGWYHCTDLDINSCYPFAMTQIPNMQGGGYRRVKKWEGRHGIYLVSGHNRKDNYGGLPNHEFIYGLNLHKIWVTGYELEIYKKYHWENIEIHRGIVCKPGKGESPLKKYAETLYDMRLQAKAVCDDLGSYRIKILLNSLYGKFIAKIEQEDGTYLTGSVFDPFLATLITGHARAQIHGLEHKYKSLHTATDAVKTKKALRKEDAGRALGQLTRGVTGNCLILRNKLYLHFDKEGELKKYALHGFRGKPTDLVDMLYGRIKGLDLYHVTKWRETIAAYHRAKQHGESLEDLRPGRFLARTFNLDLSQVDLTRYKIRVRKNKTKPDKIYLA